MDIYSDSIANRIANEVLDGIIPIKEIIDAKKGYSGEVDQNKVEEFNVVVDENPVAFVQNILTENLSKLNKIKKIVGATDEAYLELSNIIAVTIYNILSMHFNNAEIKLISLKYDEHRRAIFIRDLLTNIKEARKFIPQFDEVDVSEHFHSSQLAWLNEDISRVENKINTF